jgi:hypothetical protein
MEEVSSDSTALSVRMEIQDILRNLSERIRLESAGSIADVRKRARLAEVSAARSFYLACYKFLVGETEETTRGYLSPGQIQDLLDAALLDARELKILREEAEEKLDALSGIDPASEVGRSLMQQLAERESIAFTEVQEQETSLADASSKGLQTCISNMSEVLIDALCAARDAGCDKERIKIGKDAILRIEGAVGRWAVWFTASEHASAEKGTPEVPLSFELVTIMTSNAKLHDLVIALRQAMKLRRRQVRLCSALQRLRGASAACAALSALSGSVSVL